MVVISLRLPATFVKSRDILMGCLETSLFFGLSLVSLSDSALSRGSFSWSGWQAPGLAVFVGVDGEFSEDFSGGLVDDDDVEVVDEHPDGESFAVGAELDVVHASAASQCH